MVWFNTILQWLQLCSRRGSENSIQSREVKSLPCQPKELLQISLGDAPNRIDVSRGAIIFGIVAAQSLVHIGGAKDQQTPRSFSNPEHELETNISLQQVF